MEHIEIKKLVEVCRANGLKKASLFGSFARGEANQSSDIDLIVDFLHPVGFLALVKLER